MSESALGLRVEPVRIFSDDRGALEKIWPAAVDGEVYLVRAAPGALRGNHYHLEMGEWFVAIAGRGALVAAHPETGRVERVDLTPPGGRVRVYVPAGIAHALFNTGGDELVALALAERGHDPDDVYPFSLPAPGDAP